MPFCFQSFLPAPETSFLFLVACVPARLGGAIMFYRLPQQVLVHRAKNLVSQFQAANFGSAQIVNVNACHDLS